MAKQSGLHQIKGKVGEFSYYKQSGVSAGLIRSINEGMSARVKTGDEYANTRLNNVEFGGACNVAGVLGKLVSPKFRPMILPFSQSAMAKQILELVRTSSDEWGRRVVPSDSAVELAAILNTRSKRDPFEFVQTLTVNYSETNKINAVAEYSAGQATLMSSLGITHLLVTAKAYKVGTGKFSNVSNKVISGIAQNLSSVDVITTIPIVAGTGDGGDEDMDFNFTPLASQIWNTQNILVFVVMPIRQVGSAKHILQEYCSFYATAIPNA